MQVTEQKVPTADARRQPVWLDYRVAAKLITAGGVPCTPGNVVAPRLVIDGFGGAIATWEYQEADTQKYLKVLLDQCLEGLLNGDGCPL